MELSEAKTLIEELRGRFDAPFSSKDKETIEALYAAVCGKQFVPTTCQQCYHDALIEIIYYIKKNKKMAEQKNFILKAGAIIHSPLFMNGEVFTNDNLTDEVAMRYLAKYPGQQVLFGKFPDGYKVGDLPKEKKEHKQDGGKNLPTLAEAEAMLKKAETMLKGCETKVKNARKKVDGEKDAAKKEKEEKALANALKAAEKAKKNVEEIKDVINDLK